MKALSLWQPWATLIVDGDKRFETRSWGTDYRGPIAIHAAKTKKGWEDLDEELLLLLGAKSSPIRDAPNPDDFAHGCVVAICDLTDCLPMRDGMIAKQARIERLVGGWMPGRWAWQLENVRRVQPPIPASGRQGLWEWKPANTYVRACAWPAGTFKEDS